MINSAPGSPAIYLQVAARIRADILAGRLRPGQHVPSETYLSQQYGVARQTARRAVNVLRAEGLAVYQRGVGVVVREREEMRDFTPQAGSFVSSRMPTLEERVELDIDEGVPVFSVTTPDGSVQVLPTDRWQLRVP